MNQQAFLGEPLAQSLLTSGIEWDAELSCAACGQRSWHVDLRFAVVYGKPVALCDEECYEMLLANWQPIRGRI